MADAEGRPSLRPKFNDRRTSLRLRLRPIDLRQDRLDRGRLGPRVFGILLFGSKLSAVAERTRRHNFDFNG